jgi:hypothetical protein
MAATRGPPQGRREPLGFTTRAWGPMRGCGIGRSIERERDAALTAERGSLYPALHRLEKRGRVAPERRQTASPAIFGPVDAVLLAPIGGPRAARHRARGEARDRRRSEHGAPLAVARRAGACRRRVAWPRTERLRSDGRAHGPTTALPDARASRRSIAAYQRAVSEARDAVGPSAVREQPSARAA